MSLGFGFAGQCFGTSGDAIGAFWSSQPVNLSGAASINVFYQSQAQLIAGTWTRVTDRCTQSTTTVTCTRAESVLPVYNPYSCTLASPIDDFADGAIVGWGVAAAMVAAWAITVLRKAI